ncbi:hypothetical protein CLF_100927 [Clonorchis sinensis]|uniref:Uncharacterized protein n=1 Tax=Clonorchis sinensis TaxID=79923 RepID=G7Y4J9_CLOSI|nr:hypothetical protein CLF_100927 [Clonorchis sinensis]
MDRSRYLRTMVNDCFSCVYSRLFLFNTADKTDVVWPHGNLQQRPNYETKLIASPSIIDGADQKLTTARLGTHVDSEQVLVRGRFALRFPGPLRLQTNRLETETGGTGCQTNLPQPSSGVFSNCCKIGYELMLEGDYHGFAQYREFCLWHGATKPTQRPNYETKLIASPSIIDGADQKLTTARLGTHVDSEQVLVRGRFALRFPDFRTCEYTCTKQSQSGVFTIPSLIHFSDRWKNETNSKSLHNPGVDINSDENRVELEYADEIVLIFEEEEKGIRSSNRISNIHNFGKYVYGRFRTETFSRISITLQDILVLYRRHLRRNERDKISEFYNYLNELNPYIKFNMEIQSASADLSRENETSRKPSGVFQQDLIFHQTRVMLQRHLWSNTEGLSRSSTRNCPKSIKKNRSDRKIVCFTPDRPADVMSPLRMSKINKFRPGLPNLEVTSPFARPPRLTQLSR